MPKFSCIPFAAALCCLIALSLPSAALADALVTPLPQPDTSRLKPDQVKELEQARSAFEKVKINLIGDDLAQAYAKMGGVYARVGLNDAAAVALDDAAKLAPKVAAWPYLRGVIDRARHRNADARTDFQTALALDSSYLPIRYRLADTLVDLGDAAGARKVLADAVPAHPNQAALLSMLGRLELKQGDNASAISHLKQALLVEPQADALYKDLAQAYRRQGDEKAAGIAQAKAGTTPPNLSDPLVMRLYARVPILHGPPLQQARQLMAQRRFESARAKVTEALAADPKSIQALALGARLDALLGRHDAAQKGAALALELDPDSAVANLSQGMVYEFAGDADHAWRYYQRAQRADANQPDVLLLLGNAEMRRGDYAQAAAHYRQLLAIDSSDASVDARLAAALVAQGHCSDALTSINAQLAKRPKDAELLQVFVRLASTCDSASQQERGMALDYANALYRQRPDPGNSTALALAEAANGKFDDAQKSQAEAIYEAIRTGDTPRAQRYRTTMRDFAAGKVPKQPWPVDSVYFKPPLLTPLAPAASTSH